MISGNEWREAFWTGMLAGGCVGAVVTWLFWWWGERPRSQPPSQLAMKGGMYPPDHSVSVPPRRLTSQDIVDRAAGNPARQLDPPCICGTVFEINGLCQAKVHTRSSSRPDGWAFCGFPVPGKSGLVPCGQVATQCETHAQWQKRQKA